jgi:hypothetical protein
MDVVLCHPLGNMSEIALDMCEIGASAQKVGGQRVAGLMGHEIPDVEDVDPFAKRHAEPTVRDAPPSVGIGTSAGKQGQDGAFLVGWRTAVALDESRSCRRLTELDPPIEPLRDPDGLVELADLGLVAMTLPY